MSSLRVSSLRGETDGSSPTFPDGVVVSGVVTSTTFSGNLTGNVTGNISGTTGSFSGDVSVGGTLTYDDVTNIDSVGVITARSGIKVGAGQSISAVSGTLTYYGDGSQLTGVTAGGEADFVASGTIPNGSTVILKTDGTVTGVATAGAGTTFSPSPINYSDTEVCDLHVATYDTVKDRVVIFYKGQTGNYSQAVVGTVSETSITFGTPVQANNSRPSYHDACYDVNSGKIVYVFRDDGDSNKGKALIGTVDANNNSISFGSEEEFEVGTCSWPEVAYDANVQKVVVVWSDSGYTGRCKVGTVAGTTISFGSETVFASNNVYGKDIVYHEAAQKVVVLFKDSSSKGSGVVGTVAGDGTCNFGSLGEFESGTINSTFVEASYDPVNEKVVVVYQDESNSNYGTANVGTVNGTSITFGSPQVFAQGNSQQFAVVYDVNAAKTIIVYNLNSDGKIRESSISGTTITFEDEVTWTPVAQENPGATYNTTQGATVIGFKNPSNSGRGDAVVYRAEQITTNLTTENYIGIAAEAIANGATGKVNILGGVNTGQTGLTTAKTYYIQPNGTLATSAGNPSVVAGTSISSTEILVR